MKILEVLKEKALDEQHRAADIAAIRAQAARMHFNAVAGKAVQAVDLSEILNRAVAHGLVNRTGMENSGLKYPRRERGLLAENATVSGKDAIDTLHHIFVQARRADNILKNPNGYTLSPYHRIYGGREEGRGGWTPLFD
ncbi:hypothetical protein [Micavibrio aeruginosavorus]|uniref:hypothetical protein n=1 Tax=Micavibrio aeruginosavorus TaxID=349221 RepID=UPI003F4ABF73